MRRTIVGLAAVFAVLVLAAGYYRIGWDRMEANCQTGTGAPTDSVSYGFSLTEGFTCDFGPGLKRTSWWFDPSGPSCAPGDQARRCAG